MFVIANWLVRSSSDGVTQLTIGGVLDLHKREFSANFQGFVKLSTTLHQEDSRTSGFYDGRPIMLMCDVAPL